MVVLGHLGIRETFITATGNIIRVKCIVASTADTVTLLLQIPHVPELAVGAVSTAEFRPDDKIFSRKGYRRWLSCSLSWTRYINGSTNHKVS